MMDVFLPESVTPAAAALVIAASFFTAALTGAFGLGGGLALLVVMSLSLPMPAVIALHGVAQLGSNASRLFLLRRDAVWRIVSWFGLGSAAGVAAGANVFFALPESLLKAGVALFVLATVWGPKPPGLGPGVGSFLATGAVSGFLSVFFGATGPTAAAMLSTTSLGRSALVGTHAGCMTVQHLLKSVAFGALGFAFADWGLVIAGVLAAGFAGASLGTNMLKAMPEDLFRKGFRIAVTLVALALLGEALLVRKH